MKNRVAALLLALCLVFASACAGGGNPPDLQMDAAQTQEAPPPEADAEPAEEPGEETAPAEEPVLTLEAVQAVKFRDIPENAPYTGCAGYTACRSYLGGVAPDQFGPEELATRAMVFAALYRMSGQEAPGYNGAYPDVSAGAWYADAVSWAVRAGVIRLKAGGNLGPKEPITRAQLSVLLYWFAAGGDGGTYDTAFSAYTDGSFVPGEFRESMAWALENRLFAGVVTSGTISPNLPVTRAQLAQILTALAAYSQDEPVAEALTAQLSALIAVSASQDAHSDIQLLIDSTASKYGAIGLQVAVVEGGRVTDTYTYGWATRGKTAMTPDHKLRVASITKVAVGMSAMLLREEGLIGLDDDIGPYWGIQARNPHYPDVPITIRALLSHTSSIRAFEGTGRTQSAVRSQLSQSSGYSHVRPGAISSWNYNNYAFGVLGMTLELASGRYLDDVMGKALWSAMDIDAAFESGCISATDLLATLYYHGGGVSRSVAAQQDITPPAKPGGTGAYFAGGLTISARDLGKMAALLAGDGCYEGVRLMEAESVALMETRDEHILGDGSYQALPLRSQDAIYGRDRLYYHTGSAYGVYNLMSYDPATGDGVVVLSVGASGAKDSRGIYAVCGEISHYIYDIIATDGEELLCRAE